MCLSEVFWTMMEPVDLPQDIVKRFANKTMVIVGYETDQVQKTDKVNYQNQKK